MVSPIGSATTRLSSIPYRSSSSTCTPLWTLDLPDIDERYGPVSVASSRCIRSSKRARVRWCGRHASGTERTRVRFAVQTLHLRVACRLSFLETGPRHCTRECSSRRHAHNNVSEGTKGSRRWLRTTKMGVPGMCPWPVPEATDCGITLKVDQRVIQVSCYCMKLK